MRDRNEQTQQNGLWQTLHRATAGYLFPGDTALNWFLGAVLAFIPVRVELIIAYGTILPVFEMRLVGVGFLLFALWQTWVIARNALNEVNLTIASFLAFVPDAALVWGIVSLNPPFRPLFRVLIWAAVVYMILLGIWYAALAWRMLRAAELSRGGSDAPHQQWTVGQWRESEYVHESTSTSSSSSNGSSVGDEHAQEGEEPLGQEVDSDVATRVAPRADLASGLSAPETRKVVGEYETSPASYAGLVFAVVTAPSDRAEQIAKRIVDERLAACAQVPGEMTSFFWWENSVRRERERMIFLKTREDLVPQIAKVLKDVHPYEVPELIQLPITGGLADYLVWMNGELRPGNTLP